MRRSGILPMVVAMVMLAAGCGGDGGGDTEDEGPTTSAAGATTVPVQTTVAGTTVPATNLTLRVADVRLVNSEESDNAMRILLPAGVASASVTIGNLPSPNRVISVCQARELDKRMSGAACRTPATGEAVTVTLGSAASGVEIVQVGVTAAGPAGNTFSLDEVTIRYAASSREVSARLPPMAAGEAGGRPSFGLTPASANGAYRAGLTWTVIQVFGGTPTSAQLELVRGATVAGQAQGSADVRLTGTVPPPAGEAAIRLQNLGSAALVNPNLTALLP